MSRMKQDLGSLPQRRSHGWTHPLLHALIGTVCHFGDESQSTWGAKDRQTEALGLLVQLPQPLPLLWLRAYSVSPVVGQEGRMAPVFPTSASGHEPTHSPSVTSSVSPAADYITVGPPS